MKRRALLTGLGGLATAGLAGCLGSPGGPSDTPSETPVPDPSDSGPHPVTPSDRSFSMLSRECGQGANRATVTVNGDSVTVEGTIGGRDTCAIAVLRGVELDAGTLWMTVATEQEPSTETVACGQCLTDIGYRLDVSVDPTAFDRVVVVHESLGERITVADEPTTEG